MHIDPGTGASISINSLLSSSFTDVPVGDVRTQTFNLKNTGGFDASKLTIGSTNSPFTMTQNTCTPALTVGEACTITVEFEPFSPGSYQLDVLVSYDTGDKLVSARITLDASAIEGGGFEGFPR